MDSASFPPSSDPPSLPLQPPPLPRMRAQSTFINRNSAAVDNRGAIQKRSSIASDRNRSFSLTQADRLFRLASESGTSQTRSPASVTDCAPAATALTDSVLGLPFQWLTPQQSPQLHAFSESVPIDPFPQWTVPTPPRSDSGIPSVSVESAVDDAALCITSSSAFDQFEPVTTSDEMSSLGFLLPSQYGASPYESEQNSSNGGSGNYASTEPTSYIPPMRVSQPPPSGSTYAPAASSNPELYQHSRSGDAARRYPESSASYDQSYRATSHPYDSRPSNYSVSSAPTIPSISGLTQSAHASPPLSQMPHFSSPHLSHHRSSGSYESSGASYGTSGYPPGSSSAPYSSGGHTYPPPTSPYSSHPPTLARDGSDPASRGMNGGPRPKPQCWDHGCNGRQFSTFSNLLRHQREKSGTASKSYCPKCGAEFTRTTARNGHLAYDKCTKQRRPEDGP